MTLTPNYTLKQVAEAMGMSERWVRRKVTDGAEHMRFGHKIMFTEEQVDKLRGEHTQHPTPASITTGPKRRSA